MGCQQSAEEASPRSRPPPPGLTKYAAAKRAYGLRLLAKAAPAVAEEYELVGLLGEGETGTVFDARHRATKREHALKLFNKEAGPMVRAAVKSARLVHRLPPHPNVAARSVFVDGKACAVAVMERLRPLEEGKRYTPEEVRTIISGVVQGVAHLHAHGVAHLDLKPDNVTLRPTIGAVATEDVQLIDFGNATRFMPGEDSIDMCGGTPEWCAPEVLRMYQAAMEGRARGARFNERADVWSIGVMAAVLKTGQHPFATARGQEAVGPYLARITSGRGPVVDDDDAVFADFVAHALAVDPKHRLSVADLLTHPYLRPAPPTSDTSDDLFTVAASPVTHTATAALAQRDSLLTVVTDP